MRWDWESIMADELVTIAEYPDSMQAELAMQALADYGIKAILMGQHAADVYGGVQWVKLQVRQGDAEEARQILETEGKREDTGESEEEEEQ